MKDSRESLPVGTQIEFEQGSTYQIIGEPIGYGGGSILYPVQRLVYQDGGLKPDGFRYALKECYPVSFGHYFVRNPVGEIIPLQKNMDDEVYLQRAKAMQMQERHVTQKIYQTASRILPIRETTERILLTIPGKETAPVFNTMTVMEALSDKGQSLHGWMDSRRRFSPQETFRIIQQLLFAVREVHQAGYLHLDIQDSNVFLRGTLADKSELVTLIDFGSARRLVEGKTDPISDRVIYTTPGFSAPEIILHNDGKLRLGQEADLYSVGCLALYLLTGQRPDSKLLIANRTGIFLKPNQLHRIKCPKHLENRMQQILSKALAKMPENRYHNAEDMLADVSSLVDDLKPWRTALSAVKYDAFICYKHGPIDSIAARILQRKLENYHAPKGLSERKKPFERIFVDEGELSSCADFGHQIREVLKNSGWLIVICSRNTPLSPWVQLEIDTFLEYHDRSRILAVLTGGDETTAFPSQLAGNEYGVGSVLAADARGRNIHEITKKLKADVLLKIVAPMLNTTYDSLKQRQKIYQMRRIASATAVLMGVTSCFAAYAMNRAKIIEQQATRIQQEYETALINESRFLTEQAQKRLNDNDPLAAIELALQALPSPEQDRPVLTEAEYVLGKALNVYTTPESVQGSVIATGKITLPKKDGNTQFFLDDSGERLFSWSSEQNGVSVWDTKRMVKRMELLPDSNISGASAELLISEYSHILVRTSDKIVCVDYRSGEVIWKYDTAMILGVAISADKNQLVVLTEEVYGSGVLKLETLATGTGCLQKKIPIQILGNQRIKEGISLSPDGKWVAIVTEIVEEKNGLNPQNNLCLIDLETDDCTWVISHSPKILAVCFSGNYLAVMRSDGWGITTNEGKTVGRITTRYEGYLECYEVESTQLLWSSRTEGFLESNGINTIEAKMYKSGEAAGAGFLFVIDNQCILLDQEKGTVIRNYELPDSIITIGYTDNGFETINADGSHTSVDFDSDLGTDTMLHKLYWKDPVSAACRNGSCFYIQNNPMGISEDNTIRKYQLDKFDDGYRPIDADTVNGIRKGVKKKITFTSGGQITLSEKGGVVTQTKAQVILDFAELPVVGFWCSPDEEDLFALTEDNVLLRYEVTGGHLTGRIDLKEYNTMWLPGARAENLGWCFVSDCVLLVFTYQEAFLVDVTGPELKVKATIDHCIDYDPENNRFITEARDGEELRLGVIPYYSLEMIIEKARSVLGYSE